jgi:hypothetical protein
MSNFCSFFLLPFRVTYRKLPSTRRKKYIKRKLRQILVFLLSARVNCEREAGKFHRFLFAQRFPITLLLSHFFPSPFVLVSCTLNKISTKINGFQQSSSTVKHITMKYLKQAFRIFNRMKTKCTVMFFMEQRDWPSTINIRMHNNAIGNTQKSHRIQNCESKV